MNWNKAKNILILFLLFTSILLSAMLFSSEKKSKQVEPQTVTYALKLLKDKGVKVSPELIPITLGTVPVFESENAVTDYDEFAKRIFPINTKITDNLFTSQDGSIVFNGDSFSINFNNGIDTDTKLKSPSEKAKSYLSTIGIDVFNAEVNTSNNAQGLFTVSFTEILDNKRFFDSQISVNLLGKKIISVNGTWFTKKSTLSNNASLDSAPGLLIKFASENNDFTNLEISSLELGYAINEQGVFHKQSTILPVYQIITTDGRKFFIDARRK
ncbi:MAG: hypothetical protein UIM24_03555 [Clostridia bacterium]|nr:hypothetical protein [Clostridia bacterium]